MPRGAEILSVDKQGGDTENSIRLWALVEPSAPQVERHVFVIGTGHQVDDPELGRFIGTVLLYEGEIVAHVFEAKQ